jgi:hypothetical protein
MPTLEQAIERRLSEIHDVARSGVTELTGKGRREGGIGEGEFIGRFGGLKPAFPELLHVKDSPKQIAEAIERGKGPGYTRVYEAVRAYMQKLGYRSRGTLHRGKPTIGPHAGNTYCAHCRTFHTKGQHRFHGPGAFHKTHLFSFNPMSVSQARTVFANLMRAARMGSLTAYQKKELTVARQVLRSQRRPAMNPKKLTRKKARTMLHRHEYTSRKQQRFLGARASGYPRKNYGQLLEMRMKRTGPHRCDAKCAAAGHRYKHVFKSKPTVYGLPNGSILIEGR